MESIQVAESIAETLESVQNDLKKLKIENKLLQQQVDQLKQEKIEVISQSKEFESKKADYVSQAKSPVESQTKGSSRTIQEMMLGYTETKCLFVAVKLSIPDLLQNSPKSADELASLCGVDAHALSRMLRLLVGNGILHLEENQKFSLNPEAEILCKDHPKSCRDVILLHETILWDATSQLHSSVKTGNPVPSFGSSLYEFLSTHPEDSIIFNKAMTARFVATKDIWINEINYSSFKNVVDVGGGVGHLIKAVLSKHTHLTGTLFDFPSVVSKVEIPEELIGRLQVVGGDYNMEVPKGDLMIIRHVLHNNSDDACVTILRNCKKALSDNGKVLVIEMMLEFPMKDNRMNSMDIFMLMLLPGAKERTKDEMEALGKKAGLQLEKITATKSPLSIFEFVLIK